jgi:hypothetical protein
MKNEERMNFECEHCGTLFDRHLFDIAKSLEQVDYLGPIPSVEVEQEESVANFCSTACRNKKRQTTMQQQGVPLRRIGIGPIEPCARCGAPVDMTKFHVTFTEKSFPHSGLMRVRTRSRPITLPYSARTAGMRSLRTAKICARYSKREG